MIKIDCQQEHISSSYQRANATHEDIQSGKKIDHMDFVLYTRAWHIHYSIALNMKCCKQHATQTFIKMDGNTNPDLKIPSKKPFHIERTLAN